MVKRDSFFLSHESVSAAEREGGVEAGAKNGEENSDDEEEDDDLAASEV